MDTPVTNHGDTVDRQCHNRVVAKPEGFDYRVRADGSVVIAHRGRAATTLRGGRAATFLAEVERDDPQEVMARWTGNYRRGNERTARNHPRNVGR
jgi:hypothetical protein